MYRFAHQPTVLQEYSMGLTHSQGTFSVAESDSGDIFSAMAFESNHIKAHIDGTEAAKVRRSYLAKRTMVQSDCTGTRLTQTTNAINR